MPLPYRSQVHVNRPLTSISTAYIQDSKDFIADKVFPMVPCLKQSDRYFTYTKDYWFRSSAKKRAPATESAGGAFAIDNTPTYFCDVWAEHYDVDDQTRENADDPLDLDRDATLFLTQQLLLQREIEFMNAFMTPGIWTGHADFTPAAGLTWDNAAGIPINDILNLCIAVKAQTGYRPNTLVVAEDVHNALCNNPSVIDRIKYTQRAVVTADLMAALLGIDNYLVAGAVINTAAEGAAFAGQFMVQNTALLCYAAPAPSILKPSAGYTFGWTGLMGAGAMSSRIKTFRMEQLEADRVEAEMAYSMKQVGADLGAFILNPLATP